MGSVNLETKDSYTTRLMSGIYIPRYSPVSLLPKEEETTEATEDVTPANESDKDVTT
jgi:hypothetical protein